MKYHGLGKFKSLNKYIDHRLALISDVEASFDAIYELMFYDQENVMFEENFTYKIKKTTYGEAKKNIDIIARNIKSRLSHLPYDSVIALYLDNGPLWIEAFWAILKCGFRPLLLNMRLDDYSLGLALDLTNARMVISKGKIFSIPTMLENELLENNDTKLEDSKFGSELFVMSSGTTKNIKICAYSAYEIKNVLLQSKQIIKESKQVKRFYKGEIKLLTLLPFYHIFGFVAVYLWFGFYGRTFVKLNDLSPVTIQNTIIRHKVTHVFAVPLFWQKTYEAAIKEIKSRGEKTYNKFEKGLSLSYKPVIGPLVRKFAIKQVRDGLFKDSISFMISGGSVIDKKVLEFFNGIGYRLANGYGMSEIGITSVELSNNEKLLNSASIGLPLSGVSYEIDENGELLVKSDTLAKYIIEGPKIIDTRLRWFKTHDLASFINGRYYILGRQDDLVVSSTGENLNPNIIEENLKVENALNLCLINGRDGNMPILLVSVYRFLSKEKADALVDNLKDRINENNLSSQIGKIELIAEPFIKDDEFKMNRKKLEDNYFKGLLTRYSYKKEVEEDNDEISLNIKKMIGIILNKEAKDIASEADFFLDEGGTSLDYFVLVNRINEEYGINISSGEVPLNTVKDITSYIKERL